MRGIGIALGLLHGETVKLEAVAVNRRLIITVHTVTGLEPGIMGRPARLAIMGIVGPATHRPLKGLRQWRITHGAVGNFPERWITRLLRLPCRLNGNGISSCLEMPNRHDPL